MTPTQRTLLVILAFVALTLGSFIWFIATWDPAKEVPVTLIQLKTERMA
jgi:hypothetical protein